MTQTLQCNYTRQQLDRNVAQRDFYEFVKIMWPTIEAAKPVWNWHISYLCRALQVMAERVFQGLPKTHDLLVNVPPGTTKSTICSVMFPAWVWTKMPHAQFITASHRHDLAMDLSRKSRDIITSEKYQYLFPEIKLRHDQKVKTHFMNTLGGFRVATGSGGMVGFHGHFIIIDDPIDPSELSEVTIKSTNIWMDETLGQRTVNASISPIIMIMQRLHQDDPSSHMIETTAKEKLFHICLPAELSKDVKPEILRKYYINGLLEPNRFPETVLDAKKLKGDFFYSGQFMQNPIPRGGAMFKTDKFVIEDGFSSDMKWTKRVRFWDYADTKDAGAYTCGVLLGKNCDGRIWVLDVKRGRWDSAVRENTIKQTAQIDGKDVIIGLEQEPGSAGKFQVESTTRNLMGYRVRSLRPSGDKITRADPFAAQVNSGNVCLVNAEWNREYLNELQYFPLSTYKDQVDSSSEGFEILNGIEPWVGVLGVY